MLYKLMSERSEEVGGKFCDTRKCQILGQIPSYPYVQESKCKRKEQHSQMVEKYGLVTQKN